LGRSHQSPAASLAIVADRYTVRLTGLTTDDW
jgi:hypothetical protein